MRTSTVLLLLVFSTSRTYAQNIFSALHLNEIREYKYGRPDRIVETNTFHPSSGTTVEKKIKTFDNTGMLLVEERYDETGNLKARLTHVNDTIRRLCLQRVYESWVNERYRKETAIYSYDDHNFLIRVTDADANGNATSVTQIVNNDKGKPVELRVYDRAGNPFGVEKATYFYDRNIAVTACISNDGRTLSADTLRIDFRWRDTSSTAQNNYNTHGDALSYSSKNLDGSRTQFEEEYAYDSIGNCIDEKIYKVTVKNNGKKKRAIDRHFEKQIIYRPE